MNDNEPQVLRLTPEAALALLVERATGMLSAYRGRFAVGIAGGPGVGKSTLAVQLVEALNATDPGIAAYVPMDGFHMRHSKLESFHQTHPCGSLRNRYKSRPALAGFKSG